MKVKPQFLLIFLITLSSCITYQMTPIALQEQFGGIDSLDLRMVNVKGPLGEKYQYLSHPNKFITLTDNKGVSVLKPIKPSIEMRVTYDYEKTIIFYLDRIFVTSDTLIGHRSRFIESISKQIPLNKIEKIEIQDGRKKFTYIE